MGEIFFVSSIFSLSFFQQLVLSLICLVIVPLQFPASQLCWVLLSQIVPPSQPVVQPTGKIVSQFSLLHFQKIDVMSATK
jgi:hypothetical protein